MRLAEPVRQHAVFRDAHHHARRPDDRSIDRPGENQESDDNHENAEDDPQNLRSPHEHRHAGDQIVAIDRHAHGVGNDHRRQQRADSGKDEAVNRDDDGRALQVFQLRVLDLAIDLSQRLLAAHRQHRVAESHQDAEQPQRLRQPGPPQETQRVRGKMQIGRNRQRRQLCMIMERGDESPRQQQHHHHRGDLHDVQRFIGGLLDALGVLPPVVDGHRGGKQRGGLVHGQARVRSGQQRRRQPATRRRHAEQLIQQPGNVLPCRNS